MQSPLDIAAPVAAAFAVAAFVFAIEPIPELGFVLQCSGIGGLFGAAWRLLRPCDDEPGAIGRAMAIGSVITGAFGLAVVLVWGIIS